MKNKTLLFISLLLSSSILHADLNPLGGAGTDMVKDAATDAVKEKVTDTAKDMAKDAMKPAAAPAEAGTAEVKPAAPATTDAPKAAAESKPAMTETATTKVKKVIRKRYSKKRH